MLSFDHVSFYYKKEKPILDDISFTMQKGEFVCIVGPNGCGKSTIAKLIDGLLVPKEGTIQVFNHDTNNSSDLMNVKAEGWLCVSKSRRSIYYDLCFR